MALLAGDIGGTKTVLAVYTEGNNPHQPLVEATFPSDEYPSLTKLVQEFISRTNIPVARACFGIAGPVVDGRVKATNLPWIIAADDLEKELGIETICLLNDLEAVASAVPILREADLCVLQAGEVEPEGAIAVIAPGTGLGEGYLTWDGEQYRAHPSEGGHTDFGPTTLEQMELLRYLKTKIDHVSYERVCSGLGIPNIYAFYRDTGLFPEPSWLRDQLDQAEDPTPIISRAATETGQTCDLCKKTMDTFISILASETGNLALKVMATGGVYLGGGIPPKILPLLKVP